MDKQIINKLLDLNFNITSKGFNYWIDAIKINIKDKNKMQSIYYIIAKKYNTSWTSIERAMRHSKEKAINCLLEKYKYKGNMTNKTILELITNDLLYFDTDSIKL